MAQTATTLETIAQKLRSHEPLSRADGVYLYTQASLHDAGRMAHEVRTAKNGTRAYYVVKRYLNTTNICYAGCSFCSFAAFEKEERAYRMSLDQILEKACAEPNDYDELHIVGGHDPKQPSLEFWVAAIAELHARIPHVQLALFTAAGRG